MMHFAWQEWPNDGDQSPKSHHDERPPIVKECTQIRTPKPHLAHPHTHHRLRHVIDLKSQRLDFVSIDRESENVGASSLDHQSVDVGCQRKVLVRAWLNAGRPAHRKAAFDRRYLRPGSRWRWWRFSKGHTISVGIL